MVVDIKIVMGHNTFKMRAFCCGLLAVILTSSAAFAALDLSEIGVGARPLGMGKAYVGLADDASAIFTNPAGLSLNKNLNIISMSGVMLGDVNYILLGASDSSPFGKLGVGYINASVPGIPLTTLEGSGPSLEARQFGQTDYNSSMIVFSYGSKLSRFLRNGRGDNIALGASLKIFSQGFSGGGTSMQDAAGSGMDADLGMMWETNRWMNWGLVFQNFLPESFGGKFAWQRNQVSEGIPLITKIGGYFNLLGPTAWRQNDRMKLDLAVDYEKTSSTGRPGVFHLGTEFWPLEVFALRLGIDQKPKATESGVGVDSNLTAGVGLCFAGFAFDYAYHQFGELSENATHFFSVGYRGVDRAKEKEKARAEKKTPTIPLPEVVAKPELKAFPDVPEGYWAKKPIEYLSTLGMMEGYADGEFKPTKEITRGELAVLLVKAKGFTVGKEIKVKFKDVPLQSNEAPYISMAVERKYIKGFPDGTFKPDKRVTRAEAATALSRFSGLYQKPKVNSPPYPDLPAKHWAAPAVAATKETGLFEYLGGKGFGPKLYLTRAEAAEIISKTPFAKKQIEGLISGEKE